MRSGRIRFAGLLDGDPKTVFYWTQTIPDRTTILGTTDALHVGSGLWFYLDCEAECLTLGLFVTLLMRSSRTWFPHTDLLPIVFGCRSTLMPISYIVTGKRTWMKFCSHKLFTLMFQREFLQSQKIYSQLSVQMIRLKYVWRSGLKHFYWCYHLESLIVGMSMLYLTTCVLNCQIFDFIPKYGA